MQLSFTSFPETMFFIVLSVAIGVMLYTFGWQILKDMNTAIEEEHPLPPITIKEVSLYFTEKGYMIDKIVEVKEPTGASKKRWLAFLKKNNSFHVATLFAFGGKIEGHLESLEY